MENYYRIMPGEKSRYAEECRSENFIGMDFLISHDLTPDTQMDKSSFIQKYIPICQKDRPKKPKPSVRWTCGCLWKIANEIEEGDTILCPDKKGNYLIGKINGPYTYEAGKNLPHRRPVSWYPQTISRDTMSPKLARLTGVPLTVINVSGCSEEINILLKGEATLPQPSDEGPAVFALEEHLENFLIKNWEKTELGKDYDIYEVDGEQIGQQYEIDKTSRLDILAISKNKDKDKKEFLVVELKKGRASDVVIGQTLRYMGFVQETLAEHGEFVRGAIIASEDDKKLRIALIPVAEKISFYRYQVDFKLVKS